MDKKHSSGSCNRKAKLPTNVEEARNKEKEEESLSKQRKMDIQKETTRHKINLMQGREPSNFNLSVWIFLPSSIFSRDNH